jgi:hypothetical protein
LWTLRAAQAQCKAMSAATLGEEHMIRLWVRCLTWGINAARRRRSVNRGEQVLCGLTPHGRVASPIGAMIRRWSV